MPRTGVTEIDNLPLDMKANQEISPLTGDILTTVLHTQGEVAGSC